MGRYLKEVLKKVFKIMGGVSFIISGAALAMLVGYERPDALLAITFMFGCLAIQLLGGILLFAT